METTIVYCLTIVMMNGVSLLCNLPVILKSLFAFLLCLSDLQQEPSEGLVHGSGDLERWPVGPAAASHTSPAGQRKPAEQWPPGSGLGEPQYQRRPDQHLTSLTVTLFLWYFIWCITHVFTVIFFFWECFLEGKCTCLQALFTP